MVVEDMTASRRRLNFLRRPRLLTERKWQPPSAQIMLGSLGKTKFGQQQKYAQQKTPPAKQGTAPGTLLKLEKPSETGCAPKPATGTCACRRPGPPTMRPPKSFFAAHRNVFEHPRSKRSFGERRFNRLSDG
ncbi:uncharacterized protein THITE_2124816 [Thermothielavioides terrestris NRRL 8126]|uniref:Uncharacterized protein n=1 Tax=Thermothielavioides terrestris (strain ATCC 38088 / NRRL 8126) TaxID=578455 RepID=G2RGT7_THETT|nr:uncharacterized protein THITE_2124816 [Thermothielavioides terrestris NRRL 8126]AEO71922.1 hypothetical protein THITE_2124816 [Thermothielavioides terrestris NRRL 8126]